jgi:hypothetical protein
MTPRVSVAAAFAFALCTGTLAAPRAEQHPWVTGAVVPQPPAAYFTNLNDGDKIETPFVLKFGLSRFGLAPILKDVPSTGHHHLLVNRELPLDFTKPLPFNDQYIHFGKGQMQTVLTFAPGEYTLRLLLADHKHIPHFIYSKPMKITVTRKDDAVDGKTLVKPGVAILEPRPGVALKTPFRVQFHASGLNVSHTSNEEASTGHFQLVAEREGQAAERIVFANGATEAWLQPPTGEYVLRVQLVRNAAPRDVLATSEAISVKVAAPPAH